MAKILSGKEVAAALNSRLQARTAALAEQGVLPTLAIVRVGEREDDLSYERGAMKRCGTVGVAVRPFVLPADVRQDELLARHPRLPAVPPSAQASGRAGGM